MFSVDYPCPVASSYWPLPSHGRHIYGTHEIEKKEASMSRRGADLCTNLFGRHCRRSATSFVGEEREATRFGPVFPFRRSFAPRLAASSLTHTHTHTHILTRPLRPLQTGSFRWRYGRKCSLIAQQRLAYYSYDTRRGRHLYTTSPSNRQVTSSPYFLH